ncbi:MAG: GNAT family N-acetyltransferase [Chthoniobacteraceae bacterium]|jgi:GNAT superfamily N-acetyltransferase
MTHANSPKEDAPATRRPVEADWPRIIEILEHANYHRIGGSEMERFPLEDAFVVELDGQVAGVCGYRILDAENAKTTLMVVDPAYRGKGLGLVLQRARMDYLRECGLRYLFTNCDDDEVIAWYERHFGYRKTGGRVPKTEDFGLAEKSEWITLRCEL